MKKLLVLFLPLLLSGPGRADEGYKAVLDDGIPLHRAIKETLALIEKNPNDAALQNDLGALLAWNRTYPNALEAFEKAAALDPKDSKPLFNAGLVQVLKENWSTARSDFRKATKRDPGNFQAWWMRGWTEEQMGNTNAAVDAYKHAILVDTSLYDIRKNPFAATTRLKGRVLLETYGSRLVKASMAQQEQLEDPARVGSFFQRSRSAAPAAAPAAPPKPAPAPPAARSPAPHAAAKPAPSATDMAAPWPAMAARPAPAEAPPAPTPHPPRT